MNKNSIRCFISSFLLAACSLSGNGQTYKIVGTGQTNSYNASGIISTPTVGQSFYGQNTNHPGNTPSYTDNGDGTITDKVNGLMWEKTTDKNGDGIINYYDKMSYANALSGAAACRTGGHSDWRLPTIKEQYSLIMFYGAEANPTATSQGTAVPFINTSYFTFGYGDINSASHGATSDERLIDAQYATSSIYVATTMGGQSTMFGVNFADGRIKGYPSSSQKKYYVLYVRDNTEYGKNDFNDNGDGTITDNATKLMWMQNDNGSPILWEDALSYAENISYAGFSDWRLPDVKELQSILDYSRSPATTGSAAIDPVFHCTQITNEAGVADYPYYMSSTTFCSQTPTNGFDACYLSFGRAMGYMSTYGGWIDVHGAGAQRSDPKTGNPASFPTGFGPQGDAIRIYNYIRLVRDVPTMSDQTINFGTLPTKTYGDSPFSLTATSTSGLPVTLGSSNTAVATVSGNTVTIVGAGTTDITASQAGNSNYNAATQVKQTLTVNKANQTITFGALSVKTFSDSPFSITATSTSGLAVTYSSSNTAVATVSGNAVTIIGAGTTDIIASQAGNSNYNAATPVVQPFNVNKAEQTITFDVLPDKTFGDSPFDLIAVSTSGLPVTFSSSNTAVATVSGNRVTIVGAGTTDITASQAGNSNYNAATPVVQPFNINKAEQTITFEVLPNKTFGDASFNLSATSTSGLPVTFSSSNTAVATVSGNTVTIVGAGTTDITASQTGNSNYNAATPVVQTFNINKAEQTIIFGVLPDKTFGNAAFDLTATSTSGLPITFSSSNTAVATISANTVTIIGAGTTDITASQAGNSNYNAATPVVQPFNINKAEQTITFEGLAGKTFGDAAFDLRAVSTSGLPITFSSSTTAVATVSGNRVTIVGAGTTDITASQAGNSNYNAATPVVQPFNINKAEQTITFEGLPNKTFGDAAFDLSATSTSGLPITFSSSNTAVATVSGNTVTIVGAGTTNITASQAGNSNYHAVEAIQPFTVLIKTGIEAIPDQTIKLFPNPNNGIFTLQLDNEFTGAVSIRVTNSLGQCVKVLEVDKAAGTMIQEINLEGMAKGVCFVNMETNKQHIVKKILVY